MQKLTDAILALLQTSTFQVGDAQAPANSARPYAVLYPLDETDRDGDMSTLDVTGWFQYQITSVGDTRQQAQALADRMRALLPAGVTFTGYSGYPVQKVVNGPVERDDDVQPPLFYAIDIFEIFVAPTS